MSNQPLPAIQPAGATRRPLEGRTKIRFAIGSPTADHSDVWFAKQNEKTGDFYFGSKTIGRALKLSFHPPNTQFDKYALRFAITSEFWQERPGLRSKLKTRALATANYPPPPELGMYCAATLVFPTGFLRPARTAEAVRRVDHWFPAAPSGHAIELGFFLSRQNPLTLEHVFRGFGCPWLAFVYPDGSSISIVERNRPFERSFVPDAAAQARARWQWLGTGDAPSADTQLDDHSAVYFNEPRPGEALCLVEMHGLSLKTNSLHH